MVTKRRSGVVWGALAALVLVAIAPAPRAMAQDGAAAAPSPTLERIRDEGLLRCGVIRSGVGVSEIDQTGQWQGFFPDLCRALAAAILDDPEAVEWVEVNYVVRFEALNSGAFDVLMANTTWTATRDTELGLAFTEPVYYDGQGFLAHAALGAEKLDDLKGDASVCVSKNTTTILNLEELVRTRYPGLEIMAYESLEGVYSSFFSGECDLMTQDRVALVSQRLNRAAEPSKYVLFEDVVSKEPLGPAVRTGDEAWYDVVQWVVLSLILAEEHGITRATIADFEDSTNPEVRRLLGLEPGMGAKFGLPDIFANCAIKAVGNYGEIYARHLGEDSPLAIPRGLNALWTEGGLLYAPPLR